MDKQSSEGWKGVKQKGDTTCGKAESGSPCKEGVGRDAGKVQPCAAATMVQSRDTSQRNTEQQATTFLRAAFSMKERMPVQVNKMRQKKRGGTRRGLKSVAGCLDYQRIYCLPPCRPCCSYPEHTLGCPTKPATPSCPAPSHDTLVHPSASSPPPRPSPSPLPASQPEKETSMPLTVYGSSINFLPSFASCSMLYPGLGSLEIYTPRCHSSAGCGVEVLRC